MHRFSRRPGLKVLLFAAISAAGCASQGPKLTEYVEPTLPPDQAVTLEGKGGTYVNAVDVYYVSSEMQKYFRFQNWGGSKLVITPGFHRLALEWRRSEAVSHAVLEATFKPGHHYSIGPDTDRRRPLLIVRDQLDNSVVAEQPD